MLFTLFLNSQLLVTLAVLLNSLVGVSGYTALYTLEDTTATYYYDYGYETTGDRCAGRGSGSGTLSSVPHCENNGPTYTDLATNRIVAMNRTMMEGDLSAWCGKEVKIFQADGSELVYDEPFVLWDVCEAAESAPIIDMGVDAYLKIMDGDCMHNNGNNPTGLTIKIIDNQIWAPAPGTDSYSPTAASTLYSGGGYNGVNPTNTVVPPWGSTSATGASTATAAATSKAGSGSTSVAVAVVVSSSVSVATAGSPSSSSTSTSTTSTGTNCSKGEYKCDGGSLYECNYLSNSVDGLGCAVQASCPGGCDTALTPMCTAAKKRSRERS